MLVEVGDLVPGLRLVQFHRARGDSIDFFQFYGALLPLVRTQRGSEGGCVAEPSPCTPDAHVIEMGLLGV